MDNTNTKIDELWTPCPAGMIQKVADQAGPTLSQPAANSQDAVDRRALLKIAASVAVAAGAGTLAYRICNPAAPAVVPAAAAPLRKIPNFSQMSLGGITCEDVISKLPERIAESIEDKALTAKMDEHLKLCEKCRMILESMEDA